MTDPRSPLPAAPLRGSVRLISMIVALAAASLFSSCRSRTEQEILADEIDDMAARVEKKDSRGLVAHLADDYRDFEGRDRTQTEAMAEEYFSRYRSIKIKLLSSRIAMGEAGAATAEIEVSLYSGLASALRKGIGFSGENYRVSCLFRKGREWRVHEARWEYVPLENLFPESLKVLRELFPDL